MGLIDILITSLFTGGGDMANMMKTFSSYRYEGKLTMLPKTVRLETNWSVRFSRRISPIRIAIAVAIAMSLCQFADSHWVLSAADPLPGKSKRVISAPNADRLYPLQELEKDVTELKRGPKRGELALLTWEKSIEVISEEDFSSLRTLAEGARPVHLAMSHDGDLVGWSENKPGVILHDLRRDEMSRIDSKNSQTAIAFSPDGRWTATGCYGDRIKLWDAARELVQSLDAGQEGGVRPVFSPDSKILAVGNRNDETRLFDVPSGDLRHILPKRMTQELAFSPDGKTLAVAYVNGDVALWAVTSGELLHCQPTGAKEVYTLDWTPKGDVLVTAGLKGSIVLWEPETLSQIHELECPEWMIQVRFTSDGTRLLTAGGSQRRDQNDRKIVVWSVPNGGEK